MASRESKIKKWVNAGYHGTGDHLPAALRFAAAAPLGNGDVVIAGGYDDANHNSAGIWRFEYP